MKTRNLSLYALALATGFALILSSCSKDENIAGDMNSSPVILKAGNGPSANGHGAFYEGTSHRMFTFHASTQPNGTVKGSGLLIRVNEMGLEQKYTFDIDCLQIEESDNIAVMSGYITSTINELWPVGTAVVFRVIDKGEGSGSDPDQMTKLWMAHFYDENGNLNNDWDCTTFPLQELYDIEEGNIQVNP